MRLLLAEYFRRLGFDVQERDSGQAALEPALTGEFDCLILDVSMPGMSGLELLKQIRDRGVQTAALFLTAHDALADKVAGFEAGADDYLAKPFSPRELEYRVEALLRRSAKIQPVVEGERIEVGDLVIDKRRHEVTRRRQANRADPARVSNTGVVGHRARARLVQKCAARSRLEYRLRRLPTQYRPAHQSPAKEARDRSQETRSTY